MQDWYFENKPIQSELVVDFIGFVYIITNMTNDRKYIGKKLLKFKKTKTIKGKKKRILYNSDWETYWGSNLELKNDIKILGEHKFKREIIKLCKTKSELSYFELKEQIIRGALETKDYYNAWIMVRVRKDHLKLSKEKNNGLAT